MSAFLDAQAEESSGESSSESADGYEPRSKKSKKDKLKKKKRLASSDEEEDEEDDETRIRQEMAGFVVEPEEEGEEDGEQEKSEDEKEDEDDELDEEDLELIQDNLDIGERNRGTRIRIESDDDEEEEDDRRRIEKDLFDENDAAGRESERQPAYPAPAEDESGSESGDSESAFIVHDDGEKRDKRARRRERDMHIPDHALDEARDVFGVEDFNIEDFYADEPEMGEEDEEYEEGEEGESVRGRRTRVREKKATLLDSLEPFEIESGFLGAGDKRIQLEDRPERFQLRRIAVTEADDQELDIESHWIYDFAFSANSISRQDELFEARQKPPRQTREKIREALKFMRNQLFEVPFIAFYRKEYVEPELGINDLWKIYQWDEKWCQLQQRKQRLYELIQRMMAFQDAAAVSALPDHPRPSCSRPVAETDIAVVAEVKTAEQLTDALSQFHLYYGPDLANLTEWERAQRANLEEAGGGEVSGETAATDATKFRQATRTDKYQLCVQAGLGDLALKFGLSPLQFAENLDEGYSKHEVVQHPNDPLTTADDYVCQTFPTANDVLHGAMHMLAKQFAHHPLVRQKLREMYRNRVMITVVPTKKGRDEIDENHPLYTRRYLCNKPVKELEKDEYLRLVQGKNAGLLELRMHVDREEETREGRTLRAQIVAQKAFHKDEYSENVAQWNSLRQQIVESAINELIYPMVQRNPLSQRDPILQRELHERLMQEARDYVIRECCLKLYGYLKVGPYEMPDRVDDDEDSGNGLRVLAIAYPLERDQACFAALVDHNGQVLDHIRLVHLMKRRNAPRQEESQLKMNDLDELKRLIARRRPHVLALAGESLHALQLKADIEMMLGEDGESRRMPPPVEIVDNELAKVFAHSKKAQTDFPDYPATLRQAISLARCLIDPLPEFCQAYNPDEDILCISYHPLQSEVNKEDLLTALSLEFINRVNEVGVDVSKCLDQGYTLSMLQFICGLGPRKAAHLVKTLRQNENVLVSRPKLVTLCRMGPKVFMNCAGFIKIDTSRVAEGTDAYVEVLDGSRVHPETYEWARKMAVDALEVDDSADPTAALEEILESPERLKDLDLDAFADELQRQGFGNKCITLYDIRAELNHRYKDLRQPYKSPTREELFNMLTKETPHTFNVGKLVLGKVLHIVHRRPRNDEQSTQLHPIRDDRTNTWKCQWCHKADFREIGEVWTHLDNQLCPGQAIGVKVLLENGIKGFVPNKYISDHPETFANPAERVQPGQPVYCRVLKVDTERFQADLSCRSSDLRDVERQFRPQLDRYFDAAAEERDREAEMKTRTTQQQSNHFVKRVIAHPAFHNINFKDAEKMLQKFDQGEAVIRPSSKSTSHLTVTWKVADGVYQNIDVREEGKQQPFSLGKSLWIGSDEFEDLDEILARHVQPMVMHAREVLAYKYFLADVLAEDRDRIELHLMEEKKRALQRIPYCVCASHDLPGKFVLSYLPRVKVKHEYFTVTTEGFRFRQQMFGSLNSLVSWFKEHFRDNPVVHAYRR